MQRIGIVTDSHSSLSPALARELGVLLLPMPFIIDGEPYYEGIDLSHEVFFEKLAAGAQMATSQPAPADVLDIWDKALAQFEQVLYMPLSSGLSSSCQTAMALAQEEPYAGRVFVVDHGRIATPLHRAILDALELIDQGLDAERIRDILIASRDRVVIYLSVQTLEYLKKGGRITPAAAAVGTLLSIKPVLHLATGKLEAFKKCHGFHKAKAAMLEAVRHDMDTRFAAERDRGELHLMAASSASPEETSAWVEEIQAAFPGMDVLCDDLSLGVCCHTGAGALGVGLSCKPIE